MWFVWVIFAFESQIYRLFNGWFCGCFIAIIDFNHYFCGHSIKKQYSKSKSRSIHRFSQPSICCCHCRPKRWFKLEIFALFFWSISSGNIGLSVEFYYTVDSFFFVSYFCRFIALFNFWNLWIAGFFVEFFFFYLFIYLKYMHELCVNWCLYSQWINIHETRKYCLPTKINGWTTIDLL